MSGIAGIVRLDDAPINADNLQPMLHALHRSGPDAQGLWCDDRAGLVCASLHTTPESVKIKQPLTHHRSVWITADARIDNRRELRRLLRANGIDVSGDASDTNYILHAYEVWDSACVNYLLGDFAFAIWDSVQQRLFCARDGFGVRTFCYTRTPAVFVFGSEVRAILAHPQVTATPYMPRIADYLVQSLEGIDTTSTFYQDIYRLPPGHTLTVHDDKITLEQYWKLEPQPEIRYPYDEDYIEAFLELFEEAVRCRLRAPSPTQVGSMLSGGLDSSSVVGMARDIYRKARLGPFKTFSAVAPGMDEQEPETHHINAMIAQGNLDAVRLQPSDLPTYTTDLSYLLEHATDLFDHWMEIPQMMYIAAKHEGVKVVLTGIGGDEYASLPPSYPTYLLREGKFRQAISEIIGAHQFYAHPSTRITRTIPRHVYHAFVPRTLRTRRTQYLQRHHYNSVLAENIINHEFAQQVALKDRLTRLGKTIYNLHFTSIEAEQRYFCSHPYVTVALERYNRVASAHGVETRHPYNDRRLVEFLLALPRNQLNRQGWPKTLTRRAMRGILTDKVRFRKGVQHLGRQFQVKRYHMERKRIDWLTQGGLNLIEPYIDVSQIQTTYAECSKNNETGMRKLWYALTLALWLKGL